MKKLYNQSIREADPEVYATLEKEWLRGEKPKAISSGRHLSPGL